MQLDRLDAELGLAAGTLKELSAHRFHSFPAVNTLFNALANHPDFDKVEWSSLKISVGGGMAVQRAVAERWKQMTGKPLIEAYGLTETSPVLSVRRMERLIPGTVGPLIAGTR